MNHVIEEALILIGASVVMVPVFTRLGLGSVLGYLVAGVLVGPSGLRLIEDQHSTMHFAELGVSLLLFVIGLEIQPGKLWAMRTKLFSLGFLQVALCTLCISLVGLWLGYSAPAAVVIGFGLSLSSTAFAIQVLKEKNEFNTVHGQGAFSVLLAQDLLAIPALAIIPMFAATGAEGPSVLKSLLFFLLTLAGLFLVSRFLVKPLFRMIARSDAREIFTATSLFIVLGVSLLMVKIGLSASLGAFVAGVLLADSEYRHELEANIEPFKGMLMGLFFMAVGMGVGVELVLEKPLTVFGAAALYLLSKWLLIALIGKLNGMTLENARSMGLTIAQGGEFAFVIFGIALGGGLIPEEVNLFLVTVVTISMMASPPLSRLGDWISFRLSRDRSARPFDEIKDETPDVIIAGFGRFGQIFGRVLRSQGIPFVAIDHDSDQIDLVRRFGNKVYYGDASRTDILHSAGAKTAKYLVLAIDDVEQSLRAARNVLEHFPQLKVFARARNRGHQFELMELGVKHIKRETIDSSASFVGDLFVEMGRETPEGAAQMVKRFLRHDQAMLEEQFKVRKDDEIFVSVSNQAAAQLEQVLADESSRSYI